MKTTILRITILLLLLGRMSLAVAEVPKSAAVPPPGWTKKLRKRLAALEAANPGELGLYIKDLGTGQTFSHHADQSWYLASGVKVPIAVEVLRQIEAGRFTLETPVTLSGLDFIDGAGDTNYHAAGTVLTVRYLLEQMLLYSDNTASDLLIRQCGLPQINQTVATFVPAEFSVITSLADVRRHTYSAFHTTASRLTNAEIVRLKSERDERKKLLMLAGLLGVPVTSFNSTTLVAAFNSYYTTRMNSAPLSSFGLLLEKIAAGELLNAANTRYLLQLMERSQTGKKRIRAGLPSSYVFAHKTGTQYARFCDFGIIRPRKGAAPKRVVVAACSRGEPSLPKAERALAAIGKAIAESGVLTK